MRDMNTAFREPVDRDIRTSDPPSSHALHDKLRSEQVSAIFHNALAGTIGGLIASTCLATLFVVKGAAGIGAATGFVGAMVIQSLLRLVLFYAYFRVRPPEAKWRPWAIAACASAAIGGLCWGLGSLLLIAPAPLEFQSMVFIVCAGIAAGAITAFGTYLPAYFCNLFTIMTPTTIWAAAQNDLFHWTYAGLATLWIVVIVVLARDFAAILEKSL